MNWINPYKQGPDPEKIQAFKLRRVELDRRREALREELGLEEIQPGMTFEEGSAAHARNTERIFSAIGEGSRGNH